MFLYSSLSREVKTQEEKDLLSWTLYTEIITIICACIQLSAAGLDLSSCTVTSSTSSPPCSRVSSEPARPGLLLCWLSTISLCHCILQCHWQMSETDNNHPLLVFEIIFWEHDSPEEKCLVGPVLPEPRWGHLGPWVLCWCCPYSLCLELQRAISPLWNRRGTSAWWATFGMAALCHEKASIPPAVAFPDYLSLELLWLPLPGKLIKEPKNENKLLSSSPSLQPWPCLHTIKPQICSNYSKLTPHRHRIPDLWLKPHPQPTRGIKKQQESKAALRSCLLLIRCSSNTPFPL